MISHQSSKNILYITSTILTILIILLYLSTRKPLTSNRFIANTYGYISVAILILTIIVVLMSMKRFQITSSKILLSFVIGLICIFSIRSVDNTIGKHMLWLLFIGCMSAMIYPIYEKTISDGTTLKILMSIFVLTVSLITYVNFSKSGRFTSWGKYLMFGLLALIITELTDMIFFNLGSEKSTTRIKIYSIISVVLFSGFILYDTDKLNIKSRDIIHHNIKPDYPVESMNLFLDVINLFSSMTNLGS